MEGELARAREKALRVFKSYQAELWFMSPAEEELSPSEHPRESLHVPELSIQHR